MRLGFAVKVMGEGGLPTSDNRRWQSGPHLRHSLEMLHGVLDYCERHDIRMYRFAANIAPYATHPDLPQFHEQVEECAEELAAFGAAARARSASGSRPTRASTSSSIRRIRDTSPSRSATSRSRPRSSTRMGCGPEAVCILHVGGGAGGREAAFERFERGFERLSDARQRAPRGRERRPHVLADRRAGDPPPHRPARRLGHPTTTTASTPTASPTARRSRSRWPRGPTASPRRSTGRRRRRRWRSARRRSAAASSGLGPPPAARPRRHGRPDRLRDLPARHGRRARDFDVMLEAKAKDLALLRLRDQLTRAAWGCALGTLRQPRTARCFARLTAKARAACWRAVEARGLLARGDREGDAVEVGGAREADPREDGRVDVDDAGAAGRESRTMPGPAAMTNEVRSRRAGAAVAERRARSAGPAGRGRS